MAEHFDDLAGSGDIEKYYELGVIAPGLFAPDMEEVGADYSGPENVLQVNPEHAPDDLADGMDVTYWVPALEMKETGEISLQIPDMSLKDLVLETLEAAGGDKRVPERAIVGYGESPFHIGSDYNRQFSS